MGYGSQNMQQNKFVSKTHSIHAVTYENAYEYMTSESMIKETLLEKKGKEGKAIEFLENPPENLSKWKRRKLKKQYEEIKKTDRYKEARDFFEKETVLMDSYHEELKLEDTDSEEMILSKVADVFEATIHDSRESIMPGAIVKDPANMSEEMKKMDRLLDDMNKLVADLVTAEQAKTLITRFQDISVSNMTNGSEYLKRGEALARSPKACYTIIYHLLLHEINKNINEMSENQVNIEAFAQLNSALKVSTLAVASLTLHVDMEELLDKNEKAITEEKEKALKENAAGGVTDEQKKVSEDAKKKLEDAIQARKEKIIEQIESMKPEIEKRALAGKENKAWFEAELYAALIEEELKETYGNVTENNLKDTFNQNIILRFAERKLNHINKNLAVIEKQVQAREDLHMKISKVKDMICSQLAKKQGRKLIEENGISVDDTASLNALAQEMNEIRHLNDDELIRYYDRKDIINRSFTGALSVENNEAFWKEPITQQMIMGDVTEDELKADLKELAEQAQSNLQEIKLIIKKKVSPLHREEALEIMKQKLGARWIYAAPSVVRMRSEELLNRASITMYEVFNKERDLHNAIKEAGISIYLRKQVYHYIQQNQITFASKEELAEKLKGLKERIDQNNTFFEEQTQNRKLKKEQWAALNKWKNRNAGTEQNIFKQTLQDELKKINHKDASELLTMEEYLLGKEGEKLQKDLEGYKRRIRGEDLCDWAGFNGALSNYRDAMMNSLEEVLKSGKLAEKFSFMKGVASVEGLDALHFSEYSSFMSYIRENLGKVLNEWSKIQCFNMEKVKATLLHDMLLGKIETTEQLDTAVANELNQEELQEKADRYRFLVKMGAGIEAPGKVRFKYLDSAGTKKGMFSSSEFRPDLRQEKFDHASQAWDHLRGENMHRDFLILANKFFEEFNARKEEMEKKKERSGKEIYALYKEGMQFLGNEIVQGKNSEWMKRHLQNKSDAELDALADIFLNIKDVDGEFVSPEEYLAEMMMCQTEEYVFGAGEEDADLFASGKSEAYYLRMMEVGMNAVISNQVYMDRFKENKGIGDILFVKFRELVALNSKSMSPEEAKKQFGVGSWSEAFTDISIYMESFTKKEEDRNEYEKELAEEVDAATAVFQARELELLKYNNGALKEILPFVIKDDACWKAIMTTTDEQFKQFMEDLNQKLSSALGALEKDYSAKEAVIKEQFILTYHKEILNNAYGDEKGWEKAVNEFRDIFLTKELPNYSSIEKRIAGIKSLKKDFKKTTDITDNEYIELMGMIDLAIEKDPQLFSVFYNKKKMSALAKNMKSRKDANIAYMESTETYQKLSDVAKGEFKNKIIGEIIIEEPEVFRQKFEDLKKRTLNLMDSITVAKSSSVLDEKRKAAKSIHQKKKEGVKAQQKQTDILEELRKQRWKVGSPILQVFGNENKQFVKKEQIDKFTEEMKNRFEGLPDFLAGCLVEKLIAMGYTLVSLMLEWNDEAFDNEAAWLLDAMMKAEDIGITDEKEKNRFILHMYMNHKQDEILREKRLFNENDYVTVKEAKAYYQDFTQRSNKLEELYQQKYEDETVQAEYQELLQLIQSGFYTMKYRDLQKFIDERMQYFKNADKAMKHINKALENVKEDYQDQRVHLKIGLRSYFMKEIVLGQNLDGLPKLIEDCLNTEYMKQYLYDSSSVMGKVAYDDLNAKENLAQIHVTRKDAETYLESKEKKTIFQKYLTERTDVALLEEYNTLNLDQRKVFALSILLIGSAGGNGILTTVNLLNENVPEQKEAKDEISKEIEKYVSSDLSFDPVLDYGAVLEKLQLHDGDLNTVIFKQAIEFTKLCISRRAELIPKDWERMSDGSSSIEAAYKLSGNAETVSAVMKERAKGVANPTAFTERLKELLEKDRAKAKEGYNYLERFNEKRIFDRLDKMKGYQLQYLILVLQDRTILDRTTALDGGPFHDFVNKEKREELKGALTQDTEDAFRDAVKEDQCTKALLSLLSYQLRDDISMINRSLKKSDFKSGALGRSTVIDWRLLEEAIDLTEEIQNERLRMEAVKVAPELIERGPNELAKDAFKEYKQEVKDEESFTEFVTMQAMQDQEMNEDAKLFLVGFYSFTEAEKELFVKVLENRDMLDVSKNNYWFDLVGIKERDYVNAKGRFDLMDEYLNNALLQKGRVELQKDSYQKAFKTLLSTQIDDSASFVDMKEGEGLEDYLVRAKVFKKVRQTAVDWNLLARAIQFVKRTSNEEMIYSQDKELYISQGDLNENGAFEFESSYMRKNFHHTGNRWVRYLAKKGHREITSLFPGGIQKYVETVLNAKYANLAGEILGKEKEESSEEKDLDKIIEMENEEMLDQYIGEMPAEAVDYASELLEIDEKAAKLQKKVKKKAIDIISPNEKTKKVIEISEKYLVSKKTAEKISVAGKIEKAMEPLKDKVSKLSEFFTNAMETAKDVVKYGEAMKNLMETEEKQSDLKWKEKKDLEKAEQNQTEEQKNLSKEGYLRNTKAQEVARFGATQAYYNKVAEMIKSAEFTFAGDKINMGDATTKITEEVISAIFFIKQFFVDKKMIDRYYDTKNESNKEENRLRNAFKDGFDAKFKGGSSVGGSAMKGKIRDMNNSGKDTFTSLSKVSARELIQKSNGFTDTDEFITYTGFNIIHSLLFCASEQGKMMEWNHAIAKAILKVLDLEDCIGKQGEDEAMKVYTALMGEEFK